MAPSEPDKKAAILKLTFFTAVTLPIFIVVTLTIINYERPLVLIPDRSQKFNPYCDKNENGNSEINYFKNDSSVNFAYTLRKGVPYPFAGMAIAPDSTVFFDLHRYNNLVISLRTSNSISVRLFIHTFQDSITKPGIFLTERYNGIQIPTGKKEQSHIFSISEFVSPEWWYERNNLFPQQLNAADYSRVTTIDFNNGLSPSLDQRDTLTVTEMKFVRNNRQFYIYLGLLIIIYYTLLSLIATILKYRKRKVTKNTNIEVIPYQKIELTSASDAELKKVVSYLGQNFSDPVISVKKVALSTGLSEYKVPAIIKKGFDCSFKEYLNKIRIEEAKRLLSTTDRQITEIIFAVGYNSPPHFNHLFKEITGITPREFRETKKRNL